MNTVSLIASRLSVDQQKSIASNLVDSFTKDDSLDASAESAYITTFCDLVKIIPQIRSDYYHPILKYCLTRLEKDSFHQSFIQLSELFEDLRFPEALLAYITDQLLFYAISNKRLFTESIRKLILADEAAQGSLEITKKEIQIYLRFLEWFFMTNRTFTIKYSDHKIDKICFLYLSIDDTAIAQSASRTLKWRNESICGDKVMVHFLWEMIFLMLKTKESSLISFAYIFWLRFFNYFGVDRLRDQSSEFQKLMSSANYWECLRNGLISFVHEQRKFSLVLVQLSVQSLSVDLSLFVMKWDVKHREKYLLSWKIFFTLYEILGIDTSMNQVEAASNDLVRILSPESNIPVSFALAILSVGFRAPTDRVKRFALELAYSLPEPSLRLFKYDFSFLTGMFLPFAMSASFFTVQKVNDVEFECAYGDRISAFVCKCVESIDDQKSQSELVCSVLKLLVSSEASYQPARVYVAYGLLRGLQKLNIRCITVDMLDLLYSLFQNHAESAIWQKMLQTLHLKMLLHLDTKSINLPTLLTIIGSHIKFNGFEIYSENEEFFLDWQRITSQMMYSSFINQMRPANLSFLRSLF
ncbi:hypothetical protein FOA43_001445 [Brettanomyces nanus]|uniref:Uncharacterized protein n=1 Tax=Eeniella nana TaxID=13502 RepID=A0A875RZN4_EENNA|nr:uncharacterized protein FOA43_001445 [Brettanomyces nanus]QPG74123.1 hypothetical protein FOA43_001445 [Brettanomyces nanus]